MMTDRFELTRVERKRLDPVSLEFKQGSIARMLDLVNAAYVRGDMKIIPLPPCVEGHSQDFTSPCWSKL